ncbi:MAG: DNA-processing protein DprA, partial [Christensenellales bacterium]
MAKLTEQEKYWVWLSSIDNIGPRRFYALLEWFEDVRNIWDSARVDNDALDRFGTKIKAALVSARRDEYMEDVLRRIEAADCHVLTRLSGEYPAMLGEIVDPPPVLYWRGESFLCDRAVSIVGTRRCTRTAQEVAVKLGRELSGAGVTVVSGMARGVDSFAHQGALEGDSPTIAVLGCGVDVVYPPENRILYDRIIRQGAVV